jgi:hypothetical protein
MVSGCRASVKMRRVVFANGGRSSATPFFAVREDGLAELDPPESRKISSIDFLRWGWQDTFRLWR